jgi:uncharacterized protein
MKIISANLLLLSLVAISGPALADDLPRHGVLGIVVSPSDPAKPEDPKANPPRAQTVLPGGSAEVAGIQPGDVLVSLDSQPVTSSTDFARAVGRRLAGEKLQIQILRNGRPLMVSVTLKPRPFETSPDADVLYTSVSANGSRRRVILTHPKSSGRYPAVLLMQGLGCYTLDGALSQDQGYGPILAFLAKNGFVTVRVEKTGQGDSDGPACTDPAATADREAQGYVAAIQLLKSTDFVDPNNIFVFAHSLGPLIGALVLPQLQIRGFIASETIGRSWFEYEIENVRRQAALVGKPYDKVDEDTRAHANCAFHFYMQHESAEQVRKLAPACEDMFRSYAGVPASYMQQIGDLSLARQWQQVDFPVLVLFGTADAVTSASESRYLVDTINNFHPGRASYIELSGMGHDFLTYSSESEFINRKPTDKPHPYETELFSVLLSWLRQHSEPTRYSATKENWLRNQ